MTGQPIVILVYWCLAGLSMDSFNPHRLDAVGTFVRAHPNECAATPSDFIQEPNVDVETCRRRSMFAFMPGWLQANPGKLYLGADCELYRKERPDPLDLQALKGKVTP
jgi:hypothetical protein